MVYAKQYPGVRGKLPDLQTISWLFIHLNGEAVITGQYSPCSEIRSRAIALLWGIFVCMMCTVGNVFAQWDRLLFDAERIEIEVVGENCHISADYRFINNSEDAYRGLIYYPFAVDSELPFPDTVSVMNIGTDFDIRFEQTSKGVRFPVRIAPMAALDFRVFYIQRTPASSFRYILKTTRQWNRPLSTADFYIHIPDQFELTSISLDPDSTIYKEGHTIIRISRQRFMPDTDLEIEWREAAS